LNAYFVFINYFGIFFKDGTKDKTYQKICGPLGRTRGRGKAAGAVYAIYHFKILSLYHAKALALYRFNILKL
jgi:hypothetical protein